MLHKHQTHYSAPILFNCLYVILVGLQCSLMCLQCSLMCLQCSLMCFRCSLMSLRFSLMCPQCSLNRPSCHRRGGLRFREDGRYRPQGAVSEDLQQQARDGAGVIVLHVLRASRLLHERIPDKPRLSRIEMVPDAP
jgi:hypothetical protein